MTMQLKMAEHVLPGTSIHYRGGAVPDGYLLEDGSAVSRNAYARLFAVIGTAFGAGDGATTFNLPDSRGRVDVGAGSGPGLTARALGQTGGEEQHTLSNSEAPPLTHGHRTVGDTNGTGTIATFDFTASTGPIDEGVTTQSYQIGLGYAHNNMQPFGVATRCIRY